MSFPLQAGKSRFSTWSQNHVGSWLHPHSRWNKKTCILLNTHELIYLGGTQLIWFIGLYTHPVNIPCDPRVSCFSFLSHWRNQHWYCWEMNTTTPLASLNVINKVCCSNRWVCVSECVRATITDDTNPAEKHCLKEESVQLWCHVMSEWVREWEKRCSAAFSRKMQW